jgi:hypothetical protein
MNRSDKAALYTSVVLFVLTVMLMLAVGLGYIN